MLPHICPISHWFAICCKHKEQRRRPNTLKEGKNTQSFIYLWIKPFFPLCLVELKCPDVPNPFPRSLTPSLHRHICSPHRRNYVSKAQSDNTMKQHLTLAIALLYRIAACWTSQCTLMLPSPQGTTTRVLPKHTVTFILPTLLRPSQIQGKLGITGSRALLSRSLIIFGSAPWRFSVSYNRYPFRFIAAGAVWRCMTTCLVFGICVREPRCVQSVREQRKRVSRALWRW